ncbi:MAG: immunoglobulin domain-containing protein, partial [Verrucomicrobiota bacterium]
MAYLVSATASSGALSYAWHQTGNSFVLSTSNFLVLTNIQLTNAGTYYVVVTDARGSTQSSNVTLNVLPTGALQLYSTNLILARVGDGAQPLSGATGNTLYLDQYTTNGTYINTIQVPDEGLGEPYGTGSANSAELPVGSSSLLIAGGNVSPGNDAPYEAFLARAPNGLSISFGGYCQAYPFQGSDVSAEPGGNGGNDWRGIATVDSFGYYSLVWTNSGLYSGGNHQFHGAVDIDGNATNYYTAGEAG